MEIVLNSMLPIAVEAAQSAVEVILEVYNSPDFQTESKADNSPLTLADKRAHQVISSKLQPTGLPVLSEEGKNIPYEERKHWEYFWLVDPLDGTKEFLKRNGEFTVNIALIKNQHPVLGVVAVPVTGEIYYSTKDSGAFVNRNGKTEPLQKRTTANLSQSGLRVVASRSHLNESTQSFINSLNNPQLVSIGSSLKFMLLAERKADVYPRFAPTMEWDTAAAHAIVNSIGMTVWVRNTKQELVYNKSELLNPEFICH